MKPSVPRLAGACWLLLSTRVAFAHPGHDGHELTWDIDHLAAHPLATATSVGLLCAAGWIGLMFARSRLEGRRQIFRESQRNRGK